MRLPFASSTLLLGLLQPVHAAPELMPDGNWRDPLPGADIIQQLLTTTKHNLVALPAGTFDMGDWGPEVDPNGLPLDGTPDSKPLHKVQLSAFSISKYPVTYAEFDIFSAARRLPRINQQSEAQRYRKPRNPAGVSWQGAKHYCLWLAEQTGEPYDLPTEAQWEYAARSAGKRLLYPTNTGESDPGNNTPSYAQRKAAGGIVEIGSYPPNPAGIHDMGAGIHEWVNDWYDAAYYATSPMQNPAGPKSGTFHVMRGHFGSDSSAMTIKRWTFDNGERTGTWTRLGEGKSADQEIPHTQYSSSAANAFRCVRNR